MRTRAPLLAALVLLSLPLAARADSADAAYAKARKDYYALKRDPTQRKYRDSWLKVARAFDEVAKRFPKSGRTPDALFTAGQLYQELSQISRVNDDLAAAVDDYQKLITRYPKHHLSDDAAYWLAKIQLDRIDVPSAARKTVEAALVQQPKGDRAGDLRALLKTLPAEKPQPAKAAVAIKAAKKAPTPEPEPPDLEEPEVADGGEPTARSEIAKVIESDGAAALSQAFARISEQRAAKAGAILSAPQPTQLPAQESVAVAPKVAKARLKELGHADGGEVTLAEQLGLKVRRVVIDAGHGGHDSGAVGPDGTQEKTIALAIAKKLSHELTAMGLDVVLTRDDDTFVRLEDRAKIANAAKGDLFISIHCNSATSHKLHGIETYSLNIASDRYSIRLAARENSSSEKGMSDLRFILADLATKANTAESNRLATRVQGSLVSHLAADYKEIKDLGTKEALFYVLLGAKMPAILVETSFLSNPTEEKRLESPKYQQHVAESIAAGVQQFLNDRQRIAKLD